MKTKYRHTEQGLMLQKNGLLRIHRNDGKVLLEVLEAGQVVSRKVSGRPTQTIDPSKQKKKYKPWRRVSQKVRDMRREKLARNEHC